MNKPAVRSAAITTAKETGDAVVIQLKLDGIPDESVYFKLERLIKKYKKMKFPADVDCIISTQAFNVNIQNVDIPTFKYLADKYNESYRKNYDEKFHFSVMIELNNGVFLFINFYSKRIKIEL